MQDIQDIFQLMELRNITPAQLARNTKLSEAYISRILSGERELSAVDTFNKIANTLGITMDELYSLLYTHV